MFVEFISDGSNLRLTFAPIIILRVNFLNKRQEFFILTFDLNDVITELVNDCIYIDILYAQVM